MALGTLGAVLKFALNLEATAGAFYETATIISMNQQMKSLFEALIIQGQKRIQILMRIRRENTTEMILEPIHGLESHQFQPDTACSENCNDIDLLQLATTMENKIRSFYLSAADKVSFLSEAAYAFEDLAEEHFKNQRLLEEMG